MLYNSILSCAFACSVISCYAQPDSGLAQSISKEEIDKAKEEGAEIKIERPINFFAAAGVGFRLQDVYSVAISPMDKTVQFEKVSPIYSSLTTGVAWNPISKPFKVFYYKDKEKDWRYEYKSFWPCFALLVNVFNISFSGQQMNSVSPIDVGFGLGYRKNGLCVLATCEFTPIKQPRKYFLDAYKDKNRQLFYDNSTVPVTEISDDDNNLFTNRLIPAIGVKVAYAFNSK